MSGPRLAIAIVLFSAAAVVAAGLVRPDAPVVGAVALPMREAFQALSPAEEGPPRETLYQYTDARGAVRFVKRLEDVPSPLRERAGRVEVEPSVAGASLAASPAPRRPAGTARRAPPADAPEPADELPAWRRYESVVIYTASWCPHCKDALDDLEARGVEYARKEIDTDIDARSELKQRTGDTSVPQLFVDGRRIVGYSAQTYDGLFGKRR